MPPGPAAGPSSQAVQSRRCQSIGRAGAGSARAPGAAGRAGWGERPAPASLGPVARPQRSSPGLRPAGRAGAALAGVQPGGPLPGWPLRKQKRNRRDQQKRLGRAGGGSVALRFPAQPGPPAALRGWRQAPGRWGALGLRELLCYLESVNVFRPRQESGREEGDRPREQWLWGRACQPLSGPGGRPPRGTGRFVLIWASLCRRL